MPRYTEQSPCIFFLLNQKNIREMEEEIKKLKAGVIKVNSVTELIPLEPKPSPIPPEKVIIYVNQADLLFKELEKNPNLDYKRIKEEYDNIRAGQSKDYA